MVADKQGQVRWSYFCPRSVRDYPRESAASYLSRSTNSHHPH